MTQIALPLAYRTADGERDFFVSDANADAVRLLDKRSLWPVCAALLIGPPGSGKSHLGRIFQRQTDGALVDDLDRARDEEKLFHAWNAAQAAQRPLLMIARAYPRDWGIALPDLASRLAATPVAEIRPPDDALLGVVMVKQFRDRGLSVGPDVIDYVLARIERSFAAVASAVQALDAAALAGRRRITVPLARAALGDVMEGSPFRH